jgi:hypothetical protein
MKVDLELEREVSVRRISLGKSIAPEQRSPREKRQAATVESTTPDIEQSSLANSFGTHLEADYIESA